MALQTAWRAVTDCYSRMLFSRFAMDNISRLLNKLKQSSRHGWSNLEFLELLESVVLELVVHLQLLFHVLEVRLQFLAGGQRHRTLLALVLQLRLHVAQLLQQSASLLLARLLLGLSQTHRLENNPLLRSCSCFIYH